MGAEGATQHRAARTHNPHRDTQGLTKPESGRRGSNKGAPAREVAGRGGRARAGACGCGGRECVSVRVCVRVSVRACAPRLTQAGRVQGLCGRKRGSRRRRRRQQDKAGDAARSAPGPSIWKKLFWMTELANNSFFCFSCLGASHYRAGRRGSRGGGEEGEEQDGAEKKSWKGKEAWGGEPPKNSPSDSVFLLMPIFFLLHSSPALFS